MSNDKNINTAKNESFYKSLFNDNQEIMLLINSETWEIEDCNLSASYFYGYSYEEMLKLKITNLNIITEEQVLKEINFAKAQQKNPFDSKHRLSNGQVREVETYAIPFNLEGKNLLLFIISDITHSKTFSDTLKAESILLEKTVAKRIYKLEEGKARLEELNEILEKANQLHSVILESCPEIIVFALDCNYCYLTFNSKHKETIKAIWGKEIEVGMNMLEVISVPDDREKAKMNFDRALAGESFTLIEEYGDEQLLRLYWQIFCSPIFSNKGKVMGLTCFVQDVTEHRRTEEALDQELKFTEALLESIPGYLYVYDEAGKLIKWNKKHEEMTGYTGEELSQMTMDKWFEGEDAIRVAAAVEDVFKTGYGEVEAHLLIKGGRKLHIRTNGVRLSIAGRNYFTGVGVDITKQRKDEQKLKESEQRYKFLFDYAGVGISYYKPDGTVIFYNKKAAENMGGKPEDYAGRSIYELFSKEDADFYMGRISKAVLDDGTQEYIDYLSLNSEDRWFASTFNRIMDMDGSILGIQIISQDITELKESEKALAHSHDLMRYIIENDRSAIAIHDRDLNYVYVSQRYLDEYQVKEQNVIGKNHYDVFPDLPQKWRDVHQKALAGEISSAEEDPYVREDGTVDWTRWECRPWYEKDGSVGGIIVYTEIITERKKLEAALVNEKKLLEITLISVGDGVISCDNEGKVVILNKVAEGLTDWTQEEAKGNPIEEVFNIVNEFTREKSENIVKKVIESKKINELANHTILISKNSIERPIEDSAAPIANENGEILGVVLVFRDCSAKKQKLEEIEFLSYRDQLTGLYNRRFYEEELKRLDIEKNLPISLVMGDVNGLKLINDSFGHAMGDELLKKTAEVIKMGCRANDIIARLGGDEFVIILPKTDHCETEGIIKRIKEMSLKEKVGSIDISISFGYETKNNKEENIEDVFKNTEDHMYRHKLSESLSMRNKTIGMVMNTLFEKNSREMLHSKRVGVICERIATMLGFGTDVVNDLRTAGLMHDIGKIGIDEIILNKSSKLSDNEWNEIMRHPEIGYRILSSVNEFSEIADYILEHHERWDGKGYPRGLQGEEISLYARIIAIADAFDAMTNYRTYRKRLSEEESINEIRKCSGTQFDPEIVRVFVEKIMGKV